MIVGLLIGSSSLVGSPRPPSSCPALLRGELGTLREPTATSSPRGTPRSSCGCRAMEQTLNTTAERAGHEGRPAGSRRATKTTTQIHERLGEVTKRDRGDDRAREGPRPARAGAAPAEGARRLRRAAAREPAPRPAPADAYDDAVHVLDRRPRRRGDPRRRPARPRRLEVPARQLRADGRRRERRGARARTRRRSRATSRATSTRSPSKYVRPREGTFDFAFMYLPGRGDLLRARRAARPARCSQYAHEKRVFPVSRDDVHRVPAGDRDRPARACRSSRTRKK